MTAVCLRCHYSRSTRNANPKFSMLKKYSLVETNSVWDCSLRKSKNVSGTSSTGVETEWTWGMKEHIYNRRGHEKYRQRFHPRDTRPPPQACNPIFARKGRTRGMRHVENWALTQSNFVAADNTTYCNTAYGRFVFLVWHIVLKDGYRTCLVKGHGAVRACCSRIFLDISYVCLMTTMQLCKPLGKRLTVTVHLNEEVVARFGRLRECARQLV